MKEYKNKMLDYFNIFERADFCRKFEESVYERVNNKKITIPVYLSAGQEYISSTISHIYSILNIRPNVFIQHRGHSNYINFGGDPLKLAYELIGNEKGINDGKVGSASIFCNKNKIFGHDGLMGSQVPISVGNCYVTKNPTICFMGDASGEEDYSLTSFGWAKTKNLPILFVVEDNNLSILTEKKVRRSWELHDVAKSMGLKSFNTSDNPYDLVETFSKFDLSKDTVLLNINTTRLWYHAGAGKDFEDKNLDMHYKIFNKLNLISSEKTEKITKNNELKNKIIWEEIDANS